MPKRTKQIPEKRRLSVFRGLRRFTRTEAAALNAATALLQDPHRWKPWVEDAFSDLFQTSQGLRITLRRKNTLNAEPAESFTFAQDTISIGRSSDNDLALPLHAISRRHAQVMLRDRALYIEDLESSTGTHVQGHRLEPGQPRQLQNGEEFLIFPYAFQAFVEEVWERDEEVAVMYSQCTPMMDGDFASRLGADLCVFHLNVHPEAGSALLGLTRSFIKAALSRLIRGTVNELAGDDADLLRFVVLHVLDRANRELRFPFQCSLSPHCDGTADRGKRDKQDEAGVMLEVALKLTGAQGRLLLFMPQSTMRLAQGAAPAPRLAALGGALRWKLTLRLGFVSLAVHDLASIKPGDALLYTPRLELLLPTRVYHSAADRGWSVARHEEYANHFVIHAFVERSEGMEESENAEIESVEEDTEAAGSFDVQSLPVRVHVVLGEIELSLAQVEALRQGSIVAMDSPPSLVQLMVNGKLLGMGELVEIEDRLAVQIVRWGHA